jgi:hypothetical protein
MQITLFHYGGRIWKIVMAENLREAGSYEWLVHGEFAAVTANTIKPKFG